MFLLPSQICQAQSCRLDLKHIMPVCHLQASRDMELRWVIQQINRSVPRITILCLGRPPTESGASVDPRLTLLSCSLWQCVTWNGRGE
jgi:hypothetical protein